MASPNSKEGRGGSGGSNIMHTHMTRRPIPDSKQGRGFDDSNIMHTHMIRRLGMHHCPSLCSSLQEPRC